MHDRANRNVFQRHRVAWLNVGILAGNHNIACLQALRRKNVSLLTILVGDERDERRAVRIIFQPLALARNIELAALLLIAGRAAYALLYYTGVPFIRIPAFSLASLSTLYLAVSVLIHTLG